MRTRIFDLDGSVIHQDLLIRSSNPAILPLRTWGLTLRLACGSHSFQRFQQRLADLIGSESDEEPVLHFLGSGDFHHVSLALLRRLRHPCNLLVLDNHPDWMRGVPFLHCGTWLYHAAHLPHVRRIFHLGGEVDFDNRYRWLAPWSMLRSGKIIVIPARRCFRGRRWSQIEHRPVYRFLDEDGLAPFAEELAARPLYVSLDKDVMSASESAVNWDSGHLIARDVTDVLQVFLNAAEGQLAGMDVVGDWSPVRLTGMMRRILHWIEHPCLRVDPIEANRRNEAVNLQLFERMATLRASLAGASG